VATREIHLQVTFDYVVEVPSDWPVTDEAIEQAFYWRFDDCTDGREAFSQEMMQVGIHKMMQYVLHTAVSVHTQKIPMFDRNRKIRMRNAYQSRLENKIFHSGLRERELVEGEGHHKFTIKVESKEAEYERTPWQQDTSLLEVPET
jgi:hypothetical protein